MVGEVQLEARDARAGCPGGRGSRPGSWAASTGRCPSTAVSVVNRSPVSCMPSPESPAKRITTRSSVWTFLLLTGHPGRSEACLVRGSPGRRRSDSPSYVSCGGCDRVVFRAASGCRVGRRCQPVPRSTNRSQQGQACPRPQIDDRSQQGQAGRVPRSTDGSPQGRQVAAGVRWLAMEGYAAAAAVVLAGVLLVTAAMVARRLLAPRAVTEAGLRTYESGVDPVGTGWAQSQIRYIAFAFLYVVFAVDAVYLFPWALVLRDPELGVASLVEVVVFVGVILVGLPPRGPPRAAALDLSGRAPSHRRRAGIRSPHERRPTHAACRSGRRARPQADPVRAELGPPLLALGLQLRPGLLRHRVHRHQHGPARLHPARRDPVRATARARPT